MTKRTELDPDAALAALARDASPGPAPELVAGVLADAALATLAREAAQMAPRPTAALVERVLASAAEVAADRPAAAARPRARAGIASARGGLLDLLFGWRAGAAAAMVLALAIGFGVGLGTEPGSLPILDRPGQTDEPLSLAALDGDFLAVGGL